VELALVMGKSVRDLDPQDDKGAFDAIQSQFLQQGYRLVEWEADKSGRLSPRNRHDRPKRPGRSEEEGLAVDYCQGI